MSSFRKLAILGGAISLAAAVFLVMPRGTASQTQELTPAFHSQVPDGPLPQTMSPATFSGAVVKNAYVIAAKVKKVLYQQPCYCHCDRSIGHESLLDCFVGKHAAVCDVCMKEEFYAYEATLKKKTPAQIRDGILHGEWQQVDLSKYEAAPAKP